jgi:hypothetical protein
MINIIIAHPNIPPENKRFNVIAISLPNRINTTGEKRINKRIVIINIII